VYFSTVLPSIVFVLGTLTIVGIGEQLLNVAQWFKTFVMDSVHPAEPF